MPEKEDFFNMGDGRFRAPGQSQGAAGIIEAGDASEDAIEEMADAALRSEEAAGARSAGWSATEYIEKIYGLDPSNFENDMALLKAILAADANDGDRPENAEGFSFHDVEAYDGGSDDGDDLTPEDGGLMEPVTASMNDPEGVEQVARSVLTPEELRHVKEHGVSAAAMIEDQYGVKATAYPSEPALLQAISAARQRE